MTSTNDGKDVKSNLSSRPKDKTYYIELYKSLEARLSGDESLPARTGHVCDAWRRVYSLHQHSSPSTHPHLLNWLQRHTARTVLQTEWVKRPDEQSRLGAAIDAFTAEAEAAAGGRPRHAWEDQLLQRAAWFRRLLPDPWGHPVLKSLLAKEPVTNGQVLEWLTEERGHVFVTRLRALAASKCVDLALALADAVMGRARACRVAPRDDAADQPSEPEDDPSTFYAALRRDAGFLDVWDLLTDIEFVLLDKQDKRERCIELAKQTPLRDGYQLVERLRTRLETLPREKKLWKNAKEVATLIAQVVIARCMVVTTCTGAGRTALYCCARSLARLVAPARLPAVTAALAAPAATARHLHTLCAAIHAQCEGAMKPFVCELYVRAITAGMNELERLKLNAEKQSEARASEQTLASWFTQLGTLLSASPRLLAECALTAFSVHPAPAMFERVRRAPPSALAAAVPDTQEPAPDTSSDFGSWANDSRTQSNLVKTSKTLQLKHTQGQANVLSTAIFTEAEGLGLGPELCQDLAVLLAGPRVKTLSWDMERELLLENCRLYMERTHGGTRALTTELKYLNLDPRAFQHLPEEDDFENDGIEKGYEQHLPLEEPQEIWHAFFDPEQTESANDSEVETVPVARHRGPRSSEEDEDPLSLIAHAKKERRKQSRDKSKECKKTHKRETSKEGSKDRRKEKDKDKDKEKEKKPKKERKKKSEQPTGSLDSLLGMKVTNMPTKVQDGEKRVRKKKERRRKNNVSRVSVTVSDYDSQGKLSQLSDSNDPNVVIDGHFSMDELKSPERRNSLDTQKSIELSPAVTNNVTNVLSPAVEAVPAKATSSPKIRSTASDDSDVSRSKSPYLTPNQLTNRHVVSNKVKSNIAKLLEFRKTKPKLPRNPFPNAHLNERVNSPLPNHSLVGKKVHTSENAPKVYMNKKQTQQFEAMKSEVNDILNAALDANIANTSKIPYNEPSFEFEPKVMTPQKVYNAQRLQDMRYPQCSNSMPNLVQNSNVFSENQKAYSNYIQNSPQKPALYSNYMTSQLPQPTSVIDSSYVSPSKQAEKLYSMITTPPKSTANTLVHQPYHKSMQNLTQSDVIFDQSQKQSISDLKYFDHCSKSNSQAYIANSNSTGLKATNQTQSRPIYNYNSMQHQKAKEDLMKLYQTLPNTNLNGIHPSSSLQLNTQVSPSYKSDVTNSQSQMKSSMETILNEKLRAVSNDIAKGLSNIQIPNVPRPEHTSHPKTYGTSSHSEVNMPQNHYVHDNKPQTQQSRITQEKPSNIVKNATTVAQTKQNVQAKHVQAKPPAPKVNQSSFEEFLQDLQNSINAGVIEEGKPIVLTKEVKMTPLSATPAKKPDVTQSAKQLIQQKKTETAPSTFSRLNYMHKNKQMDLNAELNKNIMEHKFSKAKYMKNDVTISRVDKRFPSKSSTPVNTSKDCPVLARMLDASPLPMTRGTCQTSWASGKDTSTPIASQKTAASSTASREHADMLLLLRNQPTIKSPVVTSKLPSTSDIPSGQAVSNLQIINTQVPVTHQRTNEEKYATPVIGTKIRNADSFTVPKSQEKGDRTKNNEKQQDWESVMNALRAHSTPPLGPNALDMVLNKDKKHSQTTSRPQTCQKSTSSISSSSKNKSSDARKRDHNSSRSSSSTRKPSTEKIVDTPKKQNQIEFIKKALQPEAPKRPEVRNKHFTLNPIKEDDPFISGISNSDYDLLEELMDDDLRQEMCSSDEESYPPLGVSLAKNKGSCNNPKINPNVCNKVANVLNEKPQVMNPKTIVSKNASNLSSLASNSTRTPVKSCPETEYINVITKHPTIPEATRLPESRPVLCTNLDNQHTTTNIIMNQTDVMVNRSESSHYIANIATNNQMESANVIITSIPAQPMVLISQEIVYETYPTIRIQETQVGAGLCNVSQNAFVTLNPVPNIAVYQTTQFAAPVINPVIIGNATTTTTNVTKALENLQENNDFVKEDVKPAVNKIETKPENSQPINPNPAAVNKIETNPEKSEPVNSHPTAVHKVETSPQQSQPVITNATEDTHITNTDINMNKNCERKVLSQMQENNTYDNVEKDPRIRSLSVDINLPKTKQDEERIKLKRESLLNRKIIQPCYHPPIPLTYTPLGEKINIGKQMLQQGTPRNGVVKLNMKQKSSSVIENTILEDTNIESPKSETNNENIESTDQASSTKENQKVCRRILLRSSNKLQNKVRPSKSTKIVLRRAMAKQTPTEITAKVVDKDNFKKNIKVKAYSKTPTRISRRILNKAMVKVAMPKPEVAKVNQMDEKSTESSESNATPDLAMIDFENELSSSKILKTSLSAENKTDNVEQDLSECINNDLKKTENPPNVESNKSVPANIEKSVEQEELKITAPNNSTQCSQDPTALPDKLKSDLGKELVKSPSVLTSAKKSIVMTIKNRNHAILANEVTTKDTNTSQQECNKIVEPKFAPQNLKEPTLNKINASKPSLHLKNAQKLDTSIKQNTNILPPIQKKIDSHSLPSKTSEKKYENSNQPQILPIKMTAIKKTAPILPETQNTASNIPKMAPTNEQSEKLNAKIPTSTVQNATKVDPEATNQTNCGMLRNLKVRTPSMSDEARSTRSLKAVATGENICSKKTLKCQEPKKQVPAEDSSQKVETINENKDLKVDSTNKKTSVNESLICHETIDQVLGGCQKAKLGSVHEEPLLRKEDVIIEEIPIKDNENPDRKCVRVKLPNGKIFKATVFGKMLIDYDTLFADPAMRTILADGLSDGSRYTLNIKQVSKAVKSNPNKILGTHIQEINVKSKQVSIDTVNLISDDEDDDNRSFSTEFGTFNVKIDPKTISKHQKKFTQNCVVKLNKDNIFKSNRTKPKHRYSSIGSSLITRNKSKSICIKQNNTVMTPQTNITSVNILDDSSAVKSDSTKQPITQDDPIPLIPEQVDVPKELNIPDVIEIDDSSNDSFSKAPESTNQEAVNKIIELKSLLLEELGVDCKSTTEIPSNDTTDPEKAPAVESLTNALLEDLGVMTTEKVDDKIYIDEKVKKDQPVNSKAIPIRNCIVKITKCDDLIKNYEIVNKMKKCFVVLKRCDDIKTTNHVQANDIADDQKSEELNIECSDDFICFDVEETEGSQQLSRCPSVSILDNLWDDTCQPTAESVSGRSSPVMDVFEALVSLGNTFKDSSKLVEKVEKPWPCESEWTKSKHAFKVEENMYMTLIQEETKELVTIGGFDVNNPMSYQAPKLVAIVLKYFEENPNIIHRLRPFHKVQKRTLSKMPFNKLKRRIEQSADSYFAKKVRKLGTLALKAINTNSEIFKSAKSKEGEIPVLTDVTLNQEDGERCNYSKIQNEPEFRNGDITAQETIRCLNMPKNASASIQHQTEKISEVVNREVKINEVKEKPQQAHMDKTKTMSQTEVVEIQNRCTFEDVSDVTISKYCEESIVTPAKTVDNIEPDYLLDGLLPKVENTESNVTSSINTYAKENSNVSVNSDTSIDNIENDNPVIDSIEPLEEIDKNEPAKLERPLSPFENMVKTESVELQAAVYDDHLDLFSKQSESNRDDTVNIGLLDEIPDGKHIFEIIDTNIEKLVNGPQNSIEHRVPERVSEKLENVLENDTVKIEHEKIARFLSPSPCNNLLKSEIVSQTVNSASITRECEHLNLNPKDPARRCDNKAISVVLDENPIEEIPDKHNEVENTSFEESANSTQSTSELSSPEHVADKIEPSKTETSVPLPCKTADLVQLAVSNDHHISDNDVIACEVKTTTTIVEETTNISQDTRELSNPEYIADKIDTPLEIDSKCIDKNKHDKIKLTALSPTESVELRPADFDGHLRGDHQNLGIKQSEANPDNIDNILLHEVPIEKIPEEAYEVEIIDTSTEESTDVAQNTRELSSPDFDTEKTETSLEVDSEVTQLTSPLFFDNKEIMFNYHDYTKQPKIKELHIIHSEESIRCSPKHDTVADEDKLEAADVKNKEDHSCENNSITPENLHDSRMKSKPDCKYELIQDDDWLTVITTENEKDPLTDNETEDTSLKFVHVVKDPESPSTFSSEERGLTLKGIEYKDPYIGTCYVFALNESGSCASTISSDSLEVSQESSDVIESFNRSENADLYDDLHNIEFCVIAPNITYSRKSLKRKMDMSDADVVDKKYRKGKSGEKTVKHVAKRYRKGKNIDCPKLTVTSMNEMAYGKEYKQLLEYCSSVKFSYARPFHKEFIEVDLMSDWPIKNTYNYTPEDSVDKNLFFDVQDTPAYQPDPASQSLAEEIAYKYEKTDALEENLSDEAYETNFSMGFGEGSGRVIQNLKKGRVSNISAATLSDVKQSQPFLLSEDYDEYAVLKTNKDDQIKKMRQYVTFIELRDKVRSFFRKTTIELKSDWTKQHAKECEIPLTTDFPYDLCSLDYLQPSPTETIVQVVQLGQLPVSAAAQNPVSCDPRVTQVSDASPSQCSVDNSPNDDSQSEIKTEYTELTTADLTLPLVQEYAHQNQAMQQNLESHKTNNLEITEQTISLEMEIKAEERTEIKEEKLEIKEEGSNSVDNADLNTITYAKPENVEYLYDNNTIKSDSNSSIYDSSEQNSSEAFTQKRQKDGASEKTDQIAHAMNAAGITTMPESTPSSRAHAFVCSLSQKIRQGTVNTTQTTTNTYSKTTSINAMALQQALAQILPPPLNQTNNSDNNQTSTPVGPQVLHIVQGKNSSGNQITLVDNSQQSVISTPSGTQVLHIVQNKGAATGQTSNGTLGQQTNSFGGLSLVDAGLQQGGNQLLHIVNTGNQKNASPGQLLKRVNLLTNLTNVQGSNEQKMVQFVCKSADGKAIQLNAPHQRSMVLRLQPIETSNVQTPAKSTEPPELSPSPTNSATSKESASQQEIKSRSIYEENYAKFIQNSSKTANPEKSTSLPKFNQAFGKPVFQEGAQKQGDTPNANSHLPPVTTNSENAECPASDNAINLEHIRQIGSPPLLLRKPTTVTTQSQTNLVQQIKQSIAPMNIQTMHGGVIYTRQIPVNIGGGQTINLITVPSTELINNEDTPKPQTANQNEVEPSIIKIVPQNQNLTNTESSHEENNSHMSSSNENTQTPQPQPVLTQMRIKLPMLSKAPQMVPGARVVRPSFFQIQRNVIGGANQPVYQQLVLTAAPPLGQQTIRLPQAQAARPIKVPSESQSSSSESQMSSSTLEQLREFDMVLEQVKERSTVQPTANANTSSFKIHTISSDTTDGTGSSNCSNESSTQVLYSIGNNQSVNVAYVNRKATVTTPTTSTYVRSPDSSGIADSPTSSTHVQIPHTVASDSSPTEMTSQLKPAKVGSKSKSRPKSSSNPPNTLKLNTVPPKTSSQKPLEDEQTTQRILYILAEYKEQVENSPDKDKPAPRRRSNPPSNPGSSKRKKSSSSRRSGTRDTSPVHGEDTCRTMGSEDSSCGTSQGDCTESCLDSHSPQDSPRKVARKITFDQDPPLTQTRPQPQRNVIVADGQTITVARGSTGKPATAVLMPANYILPVSMVKGGQQIAIVTNRGPKILTVGGEAGAANALLLQRLIGPGGLKPVLARPGVRHVRLPTAALHNLQAFNLATATTVQNPDSTASPSPGPTPPELVDTRATSSPWTDRDDVKPERGSSPEGSEPWNLPSSADGHEYTYEETVRTDNMDRTVLDPIPDRYSPDMEAQRIFDKMFDVDSKKSYAVDSPRCAYDIDASDCDDKAYQVVQKKDGSQRHRLTHVSAAALRHKYAILEHELRLQKSLSEECEDLGVDSPSASELFPEAELLFAASPAHEHNQEAHHSHTPQPLQSTIPQPDLDDQIATDHLIPREVDMGLDVGIVTVGPDGQATIALDQEEFARSHPNTTFHSEPTDGEVQPFTITGLKGRHITSTIFHSNSAPATVLMAAPQATVISQASDHGVKYEIENMINNMPSSHNNDMNLSSVLVKDDGLTRFDSILTDSRELHLTNTASAIVHSSGNATQVIRRVCYEDDKRERDTRFLLIDESDNLIAGDDAKMITEDSRDATLESMADVDDDRSSPERHVELFWESNSASERSESRRPLDFSSDSDKCCKSPSFDETNSTDSSGVGAHMRLDSVIKEARRRERSGSVEGSSADDTHPPLRTYPPKRAYHALEGEAERSVSGKTRAGERSPDSLEGRRRASARGVVKRGCHCCNGSPAPPRPKKPRQRKPALDFASNH